ncbi:MAG: histidine kinase [Chthonomonadaceae bacterium]|nr:histidine kinase [Chthonomonadaceae bacterium]
MSGSSELGFCREQNLKRCIQIGLVGLLMGVLGSVPVAHAQVTVTADEILPKERTPYPIQTVSPDGRFAVAGNFGPGSSQNNIELFDLSGKRPLQQLTYARDPTFIEGGKAMLYWSYDLSGRNGLYLLPLPQGVARRIYPGTAQAENNGSVNGSYGTQWNPTTGEVLFVHIPASGKSSAYALRVRDGRLRVLGTERGTPRLSPDGEHMVWTGDRVYRDVASTNMLWLSTQNGISHALLSGLLLGWLPNSRDLLVLRAGSLRPVPSYGYTHDQTLLRLDTLTGRLTFLGETSSQAVVTQSRSGNWIGVLYDHHLRLIRTSNGVTLPVSREGVEAFAWGPTDTEIYVEQTGQWHRLTVLLDTGSVSSPPPASMAPDRITLTPPEPRPFQWQAALSPDPRWQIYTNTGDIRALTAMDGGLMLGTTGGLRTLHADGRERKSATWTRTLLGSEISSFAVQGDSVYLSLQREASNGIEEDVLALLDRKTGKLMQTPLGYGRQESLLDTLFPVGSRLIGLTRPGGGLTVWDTTANTVSRWSTASQPLFNATSVAIPAREGAVWLGTSYGVIRWRPESLVADVWTEKHGLAANAVLALAETDGKLWIGTIAGLSLLDVQTGIIRREAGPEALHNATITQLLPTAQTLYATTPDALFARAKATGAWRRLPLPPGNPPRYYAVGDRLFVSGGVAEPLRKLEAGTWRIVAPAPRGQLPDNRARILQAVQGALWCGTDSHLVRWDGGVSGTFRSYALPAGSGGVVSITSEGSAVWAALWKGGAMQIDPQTGHIRRWLTQMQVEGWTAPEPVNLQAVVPRPDYLYAIAYQGFLRVNRATGKTDRLSLRDFGPAGGYAAATLLQAHADRLWVNVETDGEDRLLEITLADRKITTLATRRGILQDAVPEPGRGFWTRQGPDIVLMNLQGEILRRVPIPPEDTRFALNALTRTDDSLWFATGSTIHRLKLKTGLWQRYDCPLPDVQSIAVLGDSLWVATRHGLARLHLAPGG